MLIKFIKENMPDIILTAGIIFVSIGCFLISIKMGFIIAGILMVALSLIMILSSPEGGD